MGLKVLSCWSFPPNKSTKSGARSCGFVWLTTKTAAGVMWFRGSGKPAASWGGLVRFELTELPEGSRPHNLSHEAWLPEKQVNLPTGSSESFRGVDEQ